MQYRNYYYIASTKNCSYFAIGVEKTALETITALEEEIQEEKETEGESQVSSMRYIMYGLGFLLFLLTLIIFFIWYNRKEQNP